MYPDLQTVKQIAAGGAYRACAGVLRDPFRYVYASRGDADFKKSQQTLLPAGERQSGRGMGPVFLPGIRSDHGNHLP